MTVICRSPQSVQEDPEAVGAWQDEESSSDGPAAFAERRPGGQHLIGIAHQVEHDGVEDGPGHLDDDLGRRRLDGLMEMHAKLVEESGDRDVARFLECRQLELVVGEEIGAGLDRQFARPEQTGQQDLSQPMRVRRWQKQEGMAVERSEDTDIHRQYDGFGATGHRNDLGRAAAL